MRGMIRECASAVWVRCGVWRYIGSTWGSNWRKTLGLYLRRQARFIVMMVEDKRVL